MPRRDRDALDPILAHRHCADCGWDMPVLAVDPAHDRHHLMDQIIRLQVRNQKPSYEQLEAWVKVDEAFIGWQAARRVRDLRQRDDVIDQLEADVAFAHGQLALREQR